MRKTVVAFSIASLLVLVAPLVAAAIPIDEGVSFKFRVVERGSGDPITTCRPIKMESSEAYSGPYVNVGTYRHGDSEIGESYLWYKFTPLDCPGYEFDHWAVRKTYGEDRDVGIGLTPLESLLGGQPVQTSSRMSDVIITRYNLYVYMEDGASAMVTLTLKRSGYKLKISVDPSASGEVSPYGEGTHLVPAGTEVTLRPRAHAGWRFDHWTRDGSPVTTTLLRVTMNGNHDVTAHFVKEERNVPPVPTASPSFEACDIYPDGWPYSSKYRGYTEDLEFNSDLLGNLSGKAKYWERENVILIGWMAIRPQPWSRYGIRIMEDSIVVNGTRLFAGEGRDYGVVYVECDEHYTRTAGVTKAGTRAALMWLLENPWEMRSKVIAVVEWRDLNLNGAVESQEINVIFELP